MATYPDRAQQCNHATTKRRPDEKVPCLAHLVSWETSEGSERLATSPCTGVGTDFNLLLQPDWPKGKSTVSFCAVHTARYLQERYPSKCSIMSSCTCIGSTTNQGVNFCEAHAADLRDAATTRRTSAARTRRQRSRSRTRCSRVTYDQDGDGYQEDEEEPEMDVDEEHDEPGESSQGLLDRIKDTHTTPKRVAARPSSRSPGHTPKSSIREEARNASQVSWTLSSGPFQASPECPQKRGPGLQAGGQGCGEASSLGGQC